MIYEPKNIDLNILADHFIVSDDYPRERCLAELLERQLLPDFLVLIDEEDGNINGFMIAYGIYDGLWINQIWRQSDSKLSNAIEAMRQVTAWAKERGMTSIMGETKRDEMAALQKYGFKEHSVIMKVEI